MYTKMMALLQAIALVAGLVSSAHADEKKLLTADQAKALITGKTVWVDNVNNGQKWKIYFAPDGKGYQVKGEVAGGWEIAADGKHCADWAGLKCAPVAALGDGTHARLRPNGGIAVIWTKIEDGNKL